jgi:hypothetical protein
MAGLEGIIRPFQTPNSLARRRLVAGTSVAVTPAIISWGTAGEVPAANQVDEIPIDQGGAFTVVKHEHWKEEARKSREYRIVQVLPDGTKNPDNYVDISRPYSMQFKKVDDRADPNTGLTPDQLSSKYEKQVYSSTTLDSAALAPFVSLADRSHVTSATYELSTDPTGTQLPDGGQSVP